MNTEKSDGQSRGEVAYQKLLAAIQHGELKPGTRLREVELAERLGISRTPIRDAIRRLESDGLCIHLPRQGAVIKQLDPREIIELYEMREVLEGTAARHAARHASEMEILELEDLNATMREAAGDPIRIATANRSFHQTLYRAANNRFLVNSLNGLANAMALLGGTTLKTGNRDQTAHGEHLDMINAIRERDGDAAEAAARAHIRNAQKIRLRLLRDV